MAPDLLDGQRISVDISARKIFDGKSMLSKLEMILKSNTCLIGMNKVLVGSRQSQEMKINLDFLMNIIPLPESKLKGFMLLVNFG